MNLPPAFFVFNIHHNLALMLQIHSLNYDVAIVEKVAWTQLINAYIYICMYTYMTEDDFKSKHAISYLFFLKRQFSIV